MEGIRNSRGHVSQKWLAPDYATAMLKYQPQPSGDINDHT